MSIGPLGTLSSIAASPLTQSTTADADRIRHEAASHAREVAGNRATEQAAGIGVTEEEQAAAERDADGRQFWEEAAKKQAEPSGENAEPPLAKDPHGNCGNQLDLRG